MEVLIFTKGFNQHILSVVLKACGVVFFKSFDSLTF